MYDTFGELVVPARLRIKGTSLQMIEWDEELCTQCAGQGNWVIRKGDGLTDCPPYECETHLPGS